MCWKWDEKVSSSCHQDGDMKLTSNLTRKSYKSTVENISNWNMNACILCCQNHCERKKQQQDCALSLTGEGRATERNGQLIAPSFRCDGTAITHGSASSLQLSVTTGNTSRSNSPFKASLYWCLLRTKIHNEERHSLYSSPSIVGMLESRRMWWAGHT
jgi:hypothetical protein